MKKAIVALLFIFWMSQSYAFYEASIVDGQVLTDQYANELGMTPLGSIDFNKMPVIHDTAVSDNPDEDAWKSGPDQFKAQIVIVIDKAQKGTSETAQTLKLYHKGDLLSTFIVSTGKETKVTSTSGKEYIASTPVGYFRPQSIWKKYQSTTWVGATMDFPIFFYGGIAVHSTTQNHYKELGSRASGGCIRMYREDAIKVNELVLSTGLDSYVVKPFNRKVGSTVIQRHKVVAGEIKVLGVYRQSGVIYNETLVDSWDTLIVVKNSAE